MKNKISIALIEDHPEYREAINFALEEEEGFELTYQFGSSERALSTLQNRANPAPDIILLDLNLPKMSGLEVMPWLSKYAPDAKIIILSQSSMEADVLRAVQQGAAGYLLKSATMDEIKQGIRTVNDGGATLEPGLARFILHTLQQKRPKSEVEASISAREIEVLSRVADGLSQKEISQQLKISPYTVGDHLKHIYEKLNVANAPQAISKAYETGIFPTRG